MRSIDSVKPDASLFACLRALREVLGVDRVMLSGGEPTIHPNLLELICGLDCPYRSLTTNGIVWMGDPWWSAARAAGLTKVIFSAHDATVQAFLGLEARPRTAGWALASLEAQRRNIRAALQARIPTRVNLVVYDGPESALRVMDWLRELQDGSLEIRLLNDLSHPERSLRSIETICTMLGAEEMGRERRAGTSNLTRFFRAEDGTTFTVKTSHLYFLESMCGACSVRDACYEGFYGVRVERRGGREFVRLCIYKQTTDVLMPYEDFLASSHPRALRELFARELAESA